MKKQEVGVWSEGKQQVSAGQFAGHQRGFPLRQVLRCWDVVSGDLSLLCLCRRNLLVLDFSLCHVVVTRVKVLWLGKKKNVSARVNYGTVILHKSVRQNRESKKPLYVHCTCLCRLMPIEGKDSVLEKQNKIEATISICQNLTIWRSGSYACAHYVSHLSDQCYTPCKYTSAKLEFTNVKYVYSKSVSVLPLKAFFS